nr:carbohydrate ABC transporter permease [Propionicimonas sp.]
MRDTPLQRSVSYAILFVGVLLVVVPLYSVVAVSLHPEGVTSGGLSWPSDPTFAHYVTAWTTQDFGRMILNSLVVATSVAVIAVCAAALAGYAFSVMNFRGKRLLFPILLIGIMVPFEGLILPLYFTLRHVGLTNDPVGVIAAEAGLYVSFGVLWMRQAFDSVPQAVLDAAKVDGATSWKTLWQVAMPISWPSAATLGILFFVWSWKEFLIALVLLQTQSSKTAPAGLSAFAGKYVTNVPDLAAAAVIVSLPVVVMYLFLQKQMIQGLTQGAVKG